MSLLSDTYAEQKTPVSGERATYWAMKAAEAGDPKNGWFLVLNTTPESWAAITGR